MASWLMILWVGKWTKQLTELIGLNKSYTTTIDFSLLTDTRDASFREQETRFEIIKTDTISLKRDNQLIPAPSLTTIKNKLNEILYNKDKETFLPLPTFSAKKQNGRRRYKDARKGVACEEQKIMKIFSYEILSYNFPLLQIHFSVWSWTYIRSIGYRLWKELWLGWALIQLERTSIWKYQLQSIGTTSFATWNIKGQERIIYYQETELDAIKETLHSNTD